MVLYLLKSSLGSKHENNVKQYRDIKQYIETLNNFIKINYLTL